MNLRNEIYWKFLTFQRWVLIHIFRWREADKDYPKLYEIVRIRDCPTIFCKYLKPKQVPAYVSNEIENREWYILECVGGYERNALGLLWKSANLKYGAYHEKD